MRVRECHFLRGFVRTLLRLHVNLLNDPVKPVLEYDVHPTVSSTVGVPRMWRVVRAPLAVPPVTR